MVRVVTIRVTGSWFEDSFASRQHLEKWTHNGDVISVLLRVSYPKVLKEFWWNFVSEGPY